MGLQDAVTELVRCGGTQFDPTVVSALVGLLGRESRSSAAG
jgi:HD-GYP domain-containing protein (c-di-GMP phosphodiesterase class II)